MAGLGMWMNRLGMRMTRLSGERARPSVLASWFRHEESLHYWINEDLAAGPMVCRTSGGYFERWVCRPSAFRELDLPENNAPCEGTLLVEFWASPPQALSHVYSLRTTPTWPASC